MSHAVSCCLPEVARPADACATLPVLPFALPRAIPSLPFAQPFWRHVEVHSQQLWQASVSFPVFHHPFLQFLTQLEQPVLHLTNSSKRSVVPEGLATADGLRQCSLLDLQHVTGSPTHGFASMDQLALQIAMMHLHCNSLLRDAELLLDAIVAAVTAGTFHR